VVWVPVAEEDWALAELERQADVEQARGESVADQPATPAASPDRPWGHSTTAQSEWRPGREGLDEFASTRANEDMASWFVRFPPTDEPATWPPVSQAAGSRPGSSALLRQGLVRCVRTSGVKRRSGQPINSRTNERQQLGPNKGLFEDGIGRFE
jgi:hypothetical protein